MSLTTLLSLESTWVFSAQTNMAGWTSLIVNRYFFSIHPSFWILSHVSLGELGEGGVSNQFHRKLLYNPAALLLSFHFIDKHLPGIPFYQTKTQNLKLFFFFWIFGLKSSKKHKKSHILFSLGTHILHDLGNFSTLHRFQDPPRNIRLGTFGAIVLRGSKQRCPQKSRV